LFFTSFLTALPTIRLVSFHFALSRCRIIRLRGMGQTQAALRRHAWLTQNLSSIYIPQD
jgi:hypothetical protein